ncbi:BEM_HP_G0134430.mRNA.1.CDS.1 [Saccharomyces cerevisiae]|nr:BEM_HP_G0128110.mRNA.1.CDS.1 [Saccharomyces cerevisiae]CAI4936069.1 BEM_HP_G0134430.mRNA.1.CDS.1 [Saccharomyces cerevisiae]CAI6460995.1 BEM_HP_G0128110.mRNA.1.CDS.1 [Saccharomyces cerevisiae]CAI6516672.1 BEM_HP_G0134430.mRNA.1.CDS.1 [Saccharomyces cerevisiae]
MEPIDDLLFEVTDAFKTQKEDLLELVTLIDIYGEQVNQEGSYEEKTRFIETLNTLLEDNPSTTGEIGWDLPKGLLKFLSKDNVDVNGRLGTNMIVQGVMKCFYAISIQGEPKKCLITGLELLSSLCSKDFSKSDQQNKEDFVDKKANTLPPEGVIENSSNRKDFPSYGESKSSNEFFLKLKSYILFEFIGASLKRISTLFPSKYLGAAVSTIEKFVYSHADTFEDALFLLRRVYTFCRNYIPPDPPKDIQLNEDFTREMFDKVVEEESELQVRLLRRLCTFGISTPIKTVTTNADVKYYCALNQQKFELSAYYTEYLELFCRYYQMAFSLDVDIEGEFQNVIEECRIIYKSVPQEISAVNDEAKLVLERMVYKLAYTFEVQKAAKEKNVGLDYNGVILFSGIHYLETNQHLVKEMNITDAIYLYLRFTTPSLYSKVYYNVAVESVSRYWLWYAITTEPLEDVKKELKNLSVFVTKTLLHVLLQKNCIQVNQQLRMITFTLLTRLLCLIPEKVAFEFILDVLKTSPLPLAKTSVLCVFKDLSRRRISTKDNDSETDLIVEKLSKLKVNDSNKAQQSNIRHYIQLDSSKMKAVHDCCLQTIQDSFTADAKKSHILLLLTYLNIFIVLKKTWDEDLLKIVCSKIDSNLKSVEPDKLPKYKEIVDKNESLNDYFTGIK